MGIAVSKKKVKLGALPSLCIRNKQCSSRRVRWLSLDTLLLTNKRAESVPSMDASMDASGSRDPMDPMDPQGPTAFAAFNAFVSACASAGAGARAEARAEGAGGITLRALVALSRTAEAKESQPPVLLPVAVPMPAVRWTATWWRNALQQWEHAGLVVRDAHDAFKRPLHPLDETWSPALGEAACARVLRVFARPLIAHWELAAMLTREPATTSETNADWVRALKTCLARY